MPSPNPNAVNPALGRALVHRIFFGVTSIGAALGLLYLYYSYNRRKDSEATDTSGAGGTSSTKRKRRVASGSGNGENKNRVTFADQNEIIGDGDLSPKSSSVGIRSGNEEDGIPGGAVANAKKKDLEEEAPFVGATASLSHSEKKIPVPSSPSAGVPKEEAKSPVASKVDLERTKVNDSEEQAENVKTIAAAVAVKEEEGPVGPTPKVEVQEVAIEPVAVAKVVEVSSASATNGLPVLQNEQAPLTTAITPETDYNTISMVREMTIPRDHVPGLIGKKGSHIRSIQHSSNTQINFKDESLDNGDRVCVIRGRPQDVTLAESMIEKYIMEQPLVTSHKINIPLSSVGRIIGKGGESIRMIQDLSKAKVTVDTGINHYRGAGDSGAVRTVLIRGTEEQIEAARLMVLAKVEEEKMLRRNIDLATQNRTPRRPTNSSSSNSPNTADGASASLSIASGVNGNFVPVQTKGVMEVFVSCAYHPNDFWIQVVGRESVELDKLAEAMTDWYGQIAINPDEEEYFVGDVVAAPFDVDGKMYRCKILKIDGEDAEVIYVDYGDKRVLKIREVQRLHPEFLKLRFQAIQATLNLGRIGERWSDEAIGEFCELTHCAQWLSLTARVKDYLKDPNDQKDVIWVELIDRENLNIGDELIRLGLAISSETSSPAASTSVAASNKKSYASVVAKTEDSTTTSMPPSLDGNPEEAWDAEDGFNGN